MKNKKELITGTQIGLLISDMIGLIVFGFDFGLIFANHCSITLGYFLLLIQIKLIEQK